MISVIVPVYNAEKYLDSCIKSVLNQKYEDFELLLINDGSRDNSLNICKSYALKDARVKVFDRENSGVGNTRNFGISKADGEWICFIDSDDEVNSDYLGSFKTDTTDADIVISGIDFVNIENGEVIRKEHYNSDLLFLPEDKNRLVALLQIGFPVAKAYRRSLLVDNRILFPSDISFHEDHVFIFDCYLKARAIEVVEDVTYYYRIDYSNQSLSKRKYKWESLFISSKYMVDRINRIKQKYGIEESELKVIRTFAYEPVISAVYALYEDKIGRSQRKEILRMILKGDLHISDSYYPTYNKGRLIKALSCVLPLSLLDLFFKGVNKYQHRRK